MTDPRIAVLAALSSPSWHPTPEAHGMPWDEAEQLLAAYDASRPAAAPSVPVDADLRERIAQAMADNDGWVWAEGFDKTRSPSFQGYLRAADAVLAAAVLREAAAEERLARVTEWVTSDVVTARNEFGNGYREAQRDIRDLLAGRRMADEAQQAQPLAVDRDTVERALDLLREGNHITARLLLESATSPVGEAQQAGERPADAFAAADCPYGVGPGEGSGCIKPAGHDGDHVVTAGVPVMPCSPVVRQPHMPHSWRPQPGMAYVHCPGVTTEAQTCGAWGGCTLPAGHNMGHADIPENHSTGKAQQASGIRGLLEHVGIDTTGRDIKVDGRVVDAADEAQPAGERGACGTPSPDGDCTCVLPAGHADFHADKPLEAITPDGSRMVWETPLCGDVNPEGGERCRRSPGHTSWHRDAKQKGTEAVSWLFDPS